MVGLHLRLSAETRGMIGASEFGMMKPSAIFDYHRARTRSSMKLLWSRR